MIFATVVIILVGAIGEALAPFSDPSVSVSTPNFSVAA